MVLALQIPGSLMVLVVNTSLCCIAIEAFALHHVGHALLKGSDDADVQDIALVGQDHLGGSSHDHHLPAQASGDASRNLAAPLPYSREIVTARIRLMVSIASLFMIGSSSRGTLLLSGVTAHS